MKKWHVLSLSVALIAVAVCLVPAPVLADVGDAISAKANTASNNFFKVAKKVSWYAFFAFLIILFIAKQKSAAQGNQGGESMATAGLWTVCLVQIGIIWGDTIWATVKEIFGA